MKKGFTLIEILAVVTIIGLIFILVIPKITTSLKNKKKDVDTTTNNLIVTAAKSYVADNKSKFDKVDNNTYCLPLTTLTKKDYLDSPVKNVTDDLDITNSKSVKIIYNKGFKYEVVDKKECEVVYIAPCKSDYCDSDGNEYTEVEYLESTGAQYIDTEYIPDEKTSAIIDFEPTEISGTGFLGVTESDLIVTYRLFNYGRKLYYDLDGRIYGNSMYPNERVKIELHNNYVIKNGVKVIEGAYKNDLSISNSIYLFGYNDVPYQTVGTSKMKLYSFKIYDDGELVKDFIPVLNSSDQPCLFDKVGRKCYYNQGEGEFIYPDNINNYEIIDYLESTGTQYINTGYIPNENTSIKIDFTPSKLIGTAFLGVVESDQKIVYRLFNYGGRIYYDLNGRINGNSLPANERVSIELYNNYVIKNGVKVIEGTYKNDLSISNSIYLFGYNDVPSQTVGTSKMKLYSFKIYDGGNLIRDYIPVEDNNNRPCLFDKVSKQCYYNQGTGEFLYG